MDTRLRTFAAALLCAAAIGAVAGPLEEGLEAFNAKDYAKAAALWQPLADAGDPLAQYRLGTLYAEGRGVPQSDEKAFALFLRAAEKGDAHAQYDVGASYMGGLGVKPSEVDGAKWFERAANQGMPYAQFNLGLLYASGKGVTQDAVEALKWLDVALVGLPPGGARSDVARAMADVAQKMTSDEIGEARSRARRFRPKSETP